MLIKTDKGAQYAAKMMYQTSRREKAQLVIELEGTDMQRAAELANAQSIEIPFSRLVSMTGTETGIRVTLEMEE